MRRLLLSSLVLTSMLAASPVAANDAEELEELGAAEEVEEEYYEEEEFCGGGEPTKYDEAYMAFDVADYREARDILVDALQSREVEEHERPAYLVLLGQTQLRLGQTRHAAVNFRRAITAAPATANNSGARIGLAVALARRGNGRRAAAEASRYIDEVCDGASGLARCYVANVVIASAASDEAARVAGRREARRTYAALRSYEHGAVAYYEQLFDVADWPAAATENA